MSSREILRSIGKMATGIPGFDEIANGGLPENRTTLVAGTAGSAKTLFACQFLATGITAFDQPGVFVTFEEAPEDIRVNMASFGWDIPAWEAAGKWIFVDASPQLSDHNVAVVGRYDLAGLLTRVEYAIDKIDARRLALDSLGAVFSRFQDETLIRGELFRIASALKRRSVTTVMTAERNGEYGSIARYGVEEFVTDNVVILRNALEEEKRRRTIEILKFRGAYHQKGEYPLTIQPEYGVTVIPLSAIQLKQRSSNVRISCGVDEINRMCGGGFFRDSVILVSGATGTGKTLIVTHFLAGGASEGERSMVFAFEESREQLFRNASGWGIDFAKMEADGVLEVVCLYPEVMGLEDHLVRMRAAIERFRPNRVAIDSLSALERVATPRGFREFVISLTSFIKHQEIAGLFTATTPTLLGGTSVTEAHISTITDSIILLRYVEMDGQMRRGITVLKMRGSMHDKNIREFNIDASGMHVAEPFYNINGILAGNPMYGPGVARLTTG